MRNHSGTTQSETPDSTSVVTVGSVALGTRYRDGELEAIPAFIPVGADTATELAERQLDVNSWLPHS
jgi:hypothetical protein